MKKHIFLFILILPAVSGCLKKLAQSTLADPGDQLMFLKKNITDDVIDRLKATKTVFFYKKDNSLAIDSLKQAISSGWKLTPIVFDGIENFGRYAGNPDYSYFVIEGVNTTTETKTINYSTTHYYLTLHLNKPAAKKGEPKLHGLCRIDLYPNYETIGVGSGLKVPDNVIDKLYERGVFYNWSPILLKAQLEAVASNISNHIRPWLYENIKDDNLDQTLSKDTLYVPQRLLMSFNKFSGKEKEANENIFSGYKYKYKICTDDELFNIFEKEQRGRLLFEYVKSSTDKFVTVYDLKDKKIIYKKYTPVSYNLKTKDLEEIR